MNEKFPNTEFTITLNMKVEIKHDVQLRNYVPSKLPFRFTDVAIFVTNSLVKLSLALYESNRFRGPPGPLSIQIKKFLIFSQKKVFLIFNQ